MTKISFSISDTFTITIVTRHVSRSLPISSAGLAEISAYFWLSRQFVISGLTKIQWLSLWLVFRDYVTGHVTGTVMF